MDATVVDGSHDASPGRSASGTTKGERARWLDVLRALALVRVVGYHVLGWGWLSFVFPSMGVMFALGGSLMLASLRRAEAVDVIGRRIRRLLPPFWVFGLVVVPVMIWQGFGEEPLPDASQWLFWVLPILDPPSSTWAADATVVLWYVRTYLWLVLLTPLLLAAWRRRPVVAMAVPLGIVAVDALLDGGVRDFGAVGTALVDASVFAGCWMLGFAHRDGTLRRLAALRAVLLAILAISLGVAWALSHPAGEQGIDLNDIPLGQALVSLGAVLLVLRYTPRLAWLERVPGLGRLVTVVNARAVSIYLWHNVAIALAVPLNDRLGWPSTGALIGTSVVLTAVFALGLGWVEDLAAGRRPALLPGPGQAPLRRREPRRPAPTPPVIGDGGLLLAPRTEESPLAALPAPRPGPPPHPGSRSAARPPVADRPRPLSPTVTSRALSSGRGSTGPMPSSPITTAGRAAPSSDPFDRVPDSRRAGPPSAPGPALSPSTTRPTALATSLAQAPAQDSGDEDATPIDGSDDGVERAPSGRHATHRVDRDRPPSPGSESPRRHRRSRSR